MTVLGSRRRLAVATAVAFWFAAAIALGAEPCAVEGQEAWLASIAQGRYEEALARVVAWSKAEGCACASAADECLSITVDGQARAMSPSELSDLVARTGNWVKDGHALCDQLEAGDDLGAAAKGACWDRHAKNAANGPTGAAASLWPPLLLQAAHRISAGDAPEDDGGGETSSGGVTGPRSRSPQKAKDIAREICEMRGKLDQLRERVDNMKRQPPFMRKEQANRLWEAQDSIERLEAAVARGRDKFREYAGREFDPRLDCVPEP